MVTREDMVKEFQQAMGQPVGAPLNTGQLEFRGKLLGEELEELVEEFQKIHEEEQTIGFPTRDTRAAMLKELADVQYVLSGLAVTFGLNLDEAFRRVHTSNLTKLVDGKPVIREDGKVLKGPHYVPPDLTDLV